jgi:hypothetical protein
MSSNWSRIASGVGLVVLKTLFGSSQTGHARDGVSTAATAKVRIVNGDTQPVPVYGGVSVGSDVGSPPFMRDSAEGIGLYLQSGYGYIAPGTFSGTTTFPIPEGMRLILRQLTFHARLPAGQRIDYSYLTVGTQDVHIAPKSIQDFRVTSIFGREAVYGYQDGPGDVTYSISRSNSTNAGELRSSLSGYLVPIP